MMKCYHCDEKLNPEYNGYVAIVRSTSNHIKRGQIFFHPSCFQEIAGEEYSNILKEHCEALDLEWSEEQLCRKGQKIQAIKEVRRRTGLGLKESKDLVDMYCQKHQIGR